MRVGLRGFVLFSSTSVVSNHFLSEKAMGEGNIRLTPLVACVFSGMLCCIGIATVMRGLYICSSADPKSLGVRGMG